MTGVNGHASAAVLESPGAIRDETADRKKLRLGSATVQRLLPHRPPLLFVDFVAGYERAPRPSLRAGRHISANEPVFAGHFPGFGIWPGVYTVEGLNQCCNLLAVIAALQDQWEAAGRDPAEVLDGLRHVDRVSELRPSLGADAAASLLDQLKGMGPSVGFSAGINMLFSAPVFPGSRLDYSVVETHNDKAAMRYDVEASVEGSPVAKGRLTLSQARPIPALSR